MRLKFLSLIICISIGIYISIHVLDKQITDIIIPTISILFPLIVAIMSFSNSKHFWVLSFKITYTSSSSSSKLKHFWKSNIFG